MVILKRARIEFIALILIVSSIPFVHIFKNSKNATAVNYCTSQKCKDAQAAEAKAKEERDKASAEAKSYEEEAANIGREINAIESEITSYNAQVEDLTAEIEKTEAELIKQQTALAKLIVEMHFENDVDPILLLASSKSISDLAEKEAREETVEEQVTASSKKIKETKEKLEKDKTAVELLRSDAQKKRDEASVKRARQQELARKSKESAQSYAAEAEEQRKVREAEENAERTRMINELINRSGGGARANIIVDPGLDSYAPALRASTGFSCPTDNWRYYNTNGHHGYYSWHGGYICECVGYVGYKVLERWGINVGWGDAKYWGSGAARAGYTVDNNPTVHSIGYYTSGTWGHVVWVERVNGNGTIDYSEYNGNVTANFSYVSGVNASKFRYIHFDY